MRTTQTSLFDNNDEMSVPRHYCFSQRTVVNMRVRTEPFSLASKIALLFRGSRISNQNVDHDFFFKS